MLGRGDGGAGEQRALQEAGGGFVELDARGVVEGSREGEKVEDVAVVGGGGLEVLRPLVCDPRGGRGEAGLVGVFEELFDARGGGEGEEG